MTCSRSIFRFLLLGCLTLTIGFGCTAESSSTSDPGSGDTASTSTSSGSPTTTKKAAAPSDIYTTAQEAMKKDRPDMMWALLPASYQSDITGLVQDFGKKMDAEIWDQSFAILEKFTRVLKEKRELVIGTGFLPPPIKQQLEPNLNSLTELLTIVIESEAKTVEGLQKFDTKKFLSGSGGKLLAHIKSMGANAGPEFAQEMAKMEGTKITVVEESGDTASVKLEAPGEPEKTETLVKVEGKWLPKEMVDGWQSNMDMARQSIAGMVDMPAEQKAQFQQMAGMVNGSLDQLLAATNQAEFDQAMMGVMGMVGPLMGGPGGPGGPGGMGR